MTPVTVKRYCCMENEEVCGFCTGERPVNGKSCKDGPRVAAADYDALLKEVERLTKLVDEEFI
jgi:hypothetical protein